MARFGDQRRRLVGHHLPLALLSVGALAAFMTLPVFDRSRDGGSADLSSGEFPQVRDDRQPGHEAAPPASAPSGHAGGQGSSGHGGDQPTPSASPGGASGHGDIQGGSGNHGEGPTGSPESAMDMEMGGARPPMARFTVATGYVAVGLLAATLLIGPVNLLLRRRNPVSSYLRRDVGAWTAGFSIVHVVAGLQVHGQLSDAVSYFLAADGSPLLNSFGLGNWTGLAATVIVVVLLAISSDVALRKLTARPWKRLQRLNYALFALVFAHTFFYGALLRITSPFTVLLGVSVVVVFVGQGLGIWLWRRRRARAAPALS